MLQNFENPLITITKWTAIIIYLLANGSTGQKSVMLTRSQPSKSSDGGGQAATVGTGGGGEIMAPRSNGLEPTCEELRAMWRFSKRQSRAAEMTNEIPTYRDPFAYNIWEPYYPATRSLAGIRISSRYRDATRPVYGRIIHKEPSQRFRDLSDHRTFEEVSRINGAENKAIQANNLRRTSQLRFPGTSLQTAVQPPKGRFQQLKELVWTERARELSQQRKAEELAARAAVLKEIANGHRHHANNHIHSPVNYISNQPIDFDDRAIVAEQSDVDNDPARSSGYRSSARMIGGGRKSGDRHHSRSRPDEDDDDRTVYGRRVLEGDDSREMGSYGNRPQPQSHFRERNRNAWRQMNLPDTLTLYGGSAVSEPAPSIKFDRNRRRLNGDNHSNGAFDELYDDDYLLSLMAE